MGPSMWFLFFQDNALEVSFDFEGAASAKQEEGADALDNQQRQQEADEAAIEEGSVDLNEGGRLENKCWDATDDDDEADQEQTQPTKKKEQKENIEAEGGRGQQAGDTELEAGEEGHGADACQETRDAAKDQSGAEDTSEGQAEDTVSSGARL